MKKVRVAVLGYGHLGKWHCQKAEANKDTADFVAIVEKFPANREAAKAAHPGVKIVDDIREIMNEIDAAVVVTPTSTHFELVKLLLENKKHVFCEKPLCSNDQEASALKKIAESTSVVLQVGHSERFHEAWDKLRDKLRTIPSPYTVRINRIAPFKGRATDVDVVQDLAIHDLDLLLYLFGDRPETISAHGYKIRTSKWDHAVIDVALEHGSRAQITVGRNAVREQRDLEVMSKAGAITVDLFTNMILAATNGTYPDGTFVKEEAYQKRDHLLLEHQNFYRSIHEQRPAIIGLRDGLNAVHLVDCALKSMDSGAPVKVTLV